MKIGLFFKEDLIPFRLLNLLDKIVEVWPFPSLSSQPGFLWALVLLKINLKIIFKRKNFHIFSPSYIFYVFSFLKNICLSIVCVHVHVIWGRGSMGQAEARGGSVPLSFSTCVCVCTCAPEYWPKASCGTQPLTQAVSNQFPPPTNFNSLREEASSANNHSSSVSA